MILIDPFEEEVADVYADLEEAQETLGSDFEEVLYDNLWDLYQE